MNTLPVEVENNSICFDIIKFYDEPGSIAKDAESQIGLIRRQFGNLSAQVEGFNGSLATTIGNMVSARRGADHAAGAVHGRLRSPHEENR